MGVHSKDPRLDRAISNWCRPQMVGQEFLAAGFAMVALAAVGLLVAWLVLAAS